ncbi:hypothetical protein HJC10_00250 [Corallococcus exiguus]|uniref:hypothetical protein n=1 Tax=Corallococcus TaxID=83461 RepID=UPI001470969F|nr:hypothetical protein [Corallococcus exiguus]NNB92477.1 hypothetical protein [Corallococcus exiguus]NNC01295.1 hypothetical protein [Corallococcus exiguus]
MAPETAPTEAISTERKGQGDAPSTNPTQRDEPDIMSMTADELEAFLAANEAT